MHRLPLGLAETAGVNQSSVFLSHGVNPTWTPWLNANFANSLSFILLECTPYIVIPSIISESIKLDHGTRDLRFPGKYQVD